MPESTLRCPGCGAPATADTAKCAYCGCALATVTCPGCFAPMFVGSQFCPHCGAEAARAEVDGAAPLDCPRCRTPMQALTLGSIAVRECAACGGLWVVPAILQQLCEARDEHAAIVSSLARRMPTNTAAADTVRYIPCPQCGKLMNRVNFSHSSGVIMDVCKSDGVWLDRGELQRVVDFVDHGGMAADRERQRQQLIDERRRLEAMRAFRVTTATEYTGYGASLPMGRSANESPVERLLRDALRLFGP